MSLNQEGETKMSTMEILIQAEREAYQEMMAAPPETRVEKYAAWRKAAEVAGAEMVLRYSLIKGIK